MLMIGLMMLDILAVILAYLLGSLSFAVIVSSLQEAVEICRHVED